MSSFLLAFIRFLLTLCLVFCSSLQADEGLVKTINYQGFLLDEESGAPLNGTFTMQFSLHDTGIRPAFTPPPLGNSLWQEFHEKVTVRDGIFTLRLGMFSPLGKELFDGTKDIQMTIGVVPFGTGRTDYTYLGPMQVDGHAYSVSSVAVRGTDAKTGTIQITAKPFEASDFAALLELRTPAAMTAQIGAGYRYRMLLQHLSVPGAVTGTAINIEIPKDALGQSVNLSPLNRNALVPYGTTPLFDPLAPVVPGNVGAYVQNGIVELQTLDIEPLVLNGVSQLPGDLEALDVSATGKVEVRDILMTGQQGGVVVGSSLEHCFHNPSNPVSLDDCLPFAGEAFEDHLIDPWPTDEELLAGRVSKINSLKIQSDGLDAGALKFVGAEPLADSTGYLRMSSGTIITPVMRSPYGQSGTQPGPYKLEPDGLTVLDSALLVSDRAGSIDARQTISPEQALESPLTAYTVFDLVSLAPLCQKNGQYHMAIREDYCASVPLAGDKYRDIDPCRNSDGSALPLVGLPIYCYASFTQWNHPNAGYLIENHVHDADTASAPLLIEIINSSSAGKRLIRRILPIEAVPRVDTSSMTADNIFDQNIYVRSAIEASTDNLNKARISGDNQTVYIRAENYSPNSTPTLYLQNQGFLPNLETQPAVGMVAHAGSAFLAETRISQNLTVNGNLDVSRDLHFENPAGKERFFYLPGNLTVNDIYFGPASQIAERRLLNLIEVGVQNRIEDLSNPNYYFQFNNLSKVNSLMATGDITIRGQMDVDVNAEFAAQMTAGELNIENILTTEKISDGDDPSFFVEPVQSSRIRGLNIFETLRTMGKLTIDNNLEIGGTLEVNGNFSTDGTISLSQTDQVARARKIVKISSPGYQVDPDKQSTIRSMILTQSSNWDVLGALTLSQHLHHRARSQVDGNVTVSSDTRSRSLADRSNFSSVLDPASLSLMASVEVADRIQSLTATSFSSNVSIQNHLFATGSMEAFGLVTVGQNLIYRNSIQITDGLSSPFSVDEQGHLIARSLSLSDDLFLDDLNIAGSLRLEGGSANFNVPTSMQTMQIMTHSLFGYRAQPLPPTPLTDGGAQAYISTNPMTVESAFIMDNFGQIRLYEELSSQQSVAFSTSVSLYGDTNRIMISDQASTISTVRIGISGEKDLHLAGASGQRLSARTLTISQFYDRDDPTNRYINPDGHSQIEALRISDNLSVEGRITGPQFLDLDSNRLVNLNQLSSLYSLEVLRNTTGENLNLPGFILNAEAQSPGQTLLDWQNLLLHKSENLIRSGTSVMWDSTLHINNTTGIRIADSGVGAGILLTPGDLSTLIDGSYADYLHSHDYLGGVPMDDFARIDVENTVPVSQRTTENRAFRAIEDQNVYTATGLTFLIAPKSPTTTRPVFAILRPDGSVMASLTETGLLRSTGFTGRGDLLQNIGGAHAEFPVFVAGTIPGDRLKNDSVTGENLQTQALLTRHFLNNSLPGRVLKAEGFGMASIADNSVGTPEIAPMSIQNVAIGLSQINSRIVSNSSIFSRNIADTSIQSSLIQTNNLTNRVFAMDSVSSPKIQNQSILQSKMSTNSVNSAKIISDSLFGSVFASDILSEIKIQTDAVNTSKFAHETLTNSDFSLEAVSSAKIEDYSIMNSAIRTNNLNTLALADRAIGHEQIGNSEVRTIDISSLAIQPSTGFPLLHKIANQAVTSIKIQDLNVIGAHFEAETITLSKVMNNTVSSTQITSSSIANEDILSFTLMGEKIADQSFVSTQFADASILNVHIEDGVFGPSQIATDSLNFLSFGDGVISLNKVSANTLLSTHIVDFSLINQSFSDNSLTVNKWLLQTIEGIKIATEAADLSKMRTGSVDSLRILAHQITTVALAPLSITSLPIGERQVPQNKFQPLTIQTQDIGDAQITERIVAPQSIFSTSIIDLSITGSKIPALLMTSGLFASDAVTETKIMDNQITAQLLAPSALISQNFVLDTLTGIHLDLDSVSSRTIETQQILTTHIGNLSIYSENIAAAQIDSRIVLDGSITAENILTESLTGSDFALAVATGGNVLIGAVTNQKIKDSSIDGLRFLTHTLETRHVHPQTLTSDSINPLSISSVEILDQSLPHTVFVSFVIGDEHLAPTALTTRVFASDVVTSFNIATQTLLEADFALGSVTKRQIVTNTLLNSEFSDLSILTTHIYDFSLTHREIDDLAFNPDRIQIRSGTSKGLHDLFQAPDLSDVQKIAAFSDKTVLLFSPSAGVYRRDYTSGMLQKVANFTQAVNFTHTHGTRQVWVVSGSNLYYSSEQGKNLKLVHTFPQALQHIEFNESLHGVAITSLGAYISYSSGKEWKEVLTGGDFRNMTYFSDLTYLWVTDDVGQVYYSENSGLSWQIVTTIGGTDTLTFKMRMSSPDDGHFAYRDPIPNTLYLSFSNDNWANYLKVGSNIPDTIEYSRASLGNYGQMGATNGVSYSLNHATSLFVTRPAPASISGGQAILDTNLVNDDLRVSLFRVGDHGNDLYLQFATETGVPANVNHEFFSLNDETATHREQTLISRVDATHFWLKQGHRIYRSSNTGLNFTAMKATTLNSPIWTASFFDSLNGFAALENGDLIKTVDGALTWSSVITVLPPVAARLIFARSATRGYLVEPASRVIRSSSTDDFGTSTQHTVLAAAGSIRFAKLSGQDLIWSGDNGYYGRVSDAAAPLLETQLPAGYQVNLSAISSDGSGGYFMGGVAGQLYHLKSGETVPVNLGSTYQGSANPIRDICSVDTEVFLVAGLGQDTKVSWDGGRTFRKILADEYDSTLFTSCYLGADGSLGLAGPHNPGFFLRIGTGMDSDRFASHILIDAQIDTGFTGAQITPLTLEGDKLEALSVTGDKIVSRSIMVSKIASHSVDSNKIQAATLTNRIFYDNSITNPKIGTDISGAKIGDNIILGVDFANVSITSNLIKTNSLYAGALTQTDALALRNEDFATENILTQHLRSQTFAGSRLAPGTLREHNFADQSLTSIVFTTNTISPDKVDANTFSSQQILAQQLEASHFSATGAITSSVLADSEFWQDQIPNDAIQTASLQDEGFDSSHLKSRVVSGAIIANNSVDWVAMMTASIELSQIVSDSLKGIDFAPGTITLEQIADGVINESIIQDYSIEAFQIKTADITSSKIASQSVSGSHSYLTTLTANVLRNLEYQGTKFQAGVITNSKVATNTLTSGKFKDLTEASLATASFGTTDAILFQPRVTGNDLDVLWSNGSTNYQTLGLSVGNSPLMSSARFSHDGSMVAFALLEDGLWKLAYADRNFTSIRRLPITSNEDLQAGFQWDKNGRDFYYKVKASGDVYRFNTETQESNLVDNIGGGTGILKILFAAGVEDSFQNNHIYLEGNLAKHSGGNCDTDGSSIVTDITMTPNGRYVANYQSTGTLRICDKNDGSLVYSSNVPINALMYHPTDNQHLWFISGTNRLSYAPVPSMSPVSQVISVFDGAHNSRSFLHPSHILTENTILAANVPSKTLTSGKLANLSFGPESFVASAVITAGHPQDLSILNQHIALTNLNNSEIQSASLTIGHIKSLALAGEHFLSSGVLAQHINAESIENRHMQTSQVLNQHFAANSVLSAKFANQSIVTTHILDGAVNSDTMLQAAFVDGSKIKTGIVSTGHIFDGSIGSSHIEITTLNASVFVNNSIPNSVLGARILTSGHFASNFIQGDRLEAGAIAPIPGYLLSIEGNSLYSYDPDFQSKALVPVPVQNWREVRRTAHGNRFVLTNDSFTTYQADLVSGSLSLSSTVPAQTYQIRNRFEGLYYHMDTTKLVTKTDQNVFVSEITGVDAVGFDFDPGSNELIFVKSGNQLHNTQGTIGAPLGATMSNPRAGYNSRILVVINSQEIYSYIGGVFTQLYDAGAGNTIQSLSPSLSSEVVYFTVSVGANQRVVRIMGNAGLQTGEILATLPVNTVSRLELIDYSAIAHSGITQLDAGSVTSEKIAARSFGPENFAVGAVKTANFLDLGLTSRVFINESITNAKFGGSIVAAKIQNEKLLSEHIQNGSITNAHVQDESFGTRHFQTHIISAARLQAAEVPIAKFMDNSIGENSFDDNTIPNARFADLSISAGHIADGAITNTKVADGNITADRILASSITKDSFADGAVSTVKIQNSVITSAQISAGSLTDTALEDGALTNSEITNNGFNSSVYLKDYSFTGDRFLGSIQTAQLSPLDTDAFANSIINDVRFDTSGFGTSHLQMGTLTTPQFVVGTLRASKFASGAVTRGHIDSGALLTDAKFADNAFTLAKIKDQTVSGIAVNGSQLQLAKMGSFGGESFDAAITNAKLATGGSFVLKTAHFGTTDRLTLSDFQTSVINGNNTASGSIGNAELVASAIVKAAPGILATNDLITDSLIDSNSLEAINFAEGSIPGTMVGPAFSGDKVADSSVYNLQLGSDLAVSKFVDASFQNVHIQNEIIPASVFAAASIGIGNIGEISGAEFMQATLNNNSVAANALVTADLMEKLRSTGMINLKPVHFQDEVFTATNVGKIVRKNSIDPADPLTENRFFFGAIPDNALSSGVASESVTMGLLNTAAGNFQSLFTGIESTLHSHNVLLQPIACPTGYEAVTGTGNNGNSFCISAEMTSNTINSHRNSARSITLAGIGSSVSGQVCSLEQLIAARRKPIPINNVAMSSTISIEPLGYSAEVRYQTLGTFNPTDGGGSFSSALLSQSAVAHYCL